MKVRQNRFAPALIGRLATAGTAAVLCLVLASPTPAYAITREEVLSRATAWVNKRVGYSRSAMYGGYRRDCSGMVSMAWKLRGSYTSRSIASRARRIPVSALLPGDAILTPGHVAVFGGWANRRAGTFVALEQSGHGAGAVRRVRRLARGAVALRYRGISEAVAVAPTAAPSPVEAAAPVAQTP